MSVPFDAFQRLAPPLREEDKPLLLARLQAQFDDETDEIAAAAWAMGARAFCNSALGRAICRVCGCWEIEACEGGCSWVEPDLCSSCSPGRASRTRDPDAAPGQRDTTPMPRRGRARRNDERLFPMSDTLNDKPIFPPARWAAEQVEEFTANFHKGAAFTVVNTRNAEALTLTLLRAPKCDVAVEAASIDAASITARQIADNPFAFAFGLHTEVRLGPNEVGHIVGRAEYAHAEASYFVRYVAGDGRQVEAWWGESALTPT